MPQLEQIDTFTSQIFWLFAFFAMIYFFISKSAAPKILDVVNGREDIINGNISTAKKAKDNAKDAFEALEKKLSVSKLESVNMISEANVSTNRFYNEELAKAELQIKSEFSKAESEINSAMSDAISQLRSESAIFVEDILSKIAGLKVERKTVEKALADSN